MYGKIGVWRVLWELDLAQTWLVVRTHKRFSFPSDWLPPRKHRGRGARRSIPIDCERITDASHGPALRSRHVASWTRSRSTYILIVGSIIAPFLHIKRLIVHVNIARIYARHEYTSHMPDGPGHSRPAMITSSTLAAELAACSITAPLLHAKAYSTRKHRVHVPGMSTVRVMSDSHSTRRHDYSSTLPGGRRELACMGPGQKHVLFAGSITAPSLTAHQGLQYTFYLTHTARGFTK